MALTEMQLPAKAEFYRDVQSVAGEILRGMARWQQMSEFIQTMGADDLDAMGVPQGQIRTDLTNFRAALDAVVVEIDSQQAAFDAVRKALIF